LAQVALGGFLAVLSATVVGLALMVGGRAGRRTALPFGPFLAGGAMAAVLFGGPLVHLWLGGS
jgi:leader peptidase (prepilin peptidase)/N-methyltransferase